MGTISLNLTEDSVEEAKQGSGGNDEPVPEGDYDAVIFNAEKGETQNSYKFGDEERTSTYINAEFRITNGEYEDRRVFDLYMTETPDQKKVDGQWANTEYTWHDGFIDLLEATDNMEQVLNEGELDLDGLLGEEVRINVYHTEDEEYGTQANANVNPPASDSGDGEDSFIPE